jgi:acetyl esterase/lipase
VQAYQAQLAQAQLAYRYVTQLSQVDATRIVVGGEFFSTLFERVLVSAKRMHAGHSAGAHLAWFGVLNNSFRYKPVHCSLSTAAFTVSMPLAPTCLPLLA